MQARSFCTQSTVLIHYCHTFALRRASVAVAVAVFGLIMEGGGGQFVVQKKLLVQQLHFSFLPCEHGFDTHSACTFVHFPLPG